MFVINFYVFFIFLYQFLINILKISYFLQFKDNFLYVFFKKSRNFMQIKPIKNKAQ